MGKSCAPARGILEEEEMDAIEYLKEKERMCRSCYCDKCGMSEDDGSMCCSSCTEQTKPEEAVRIVEKWSRAHPVQTNAQKFEEVFGETINTRFPKCLPWIGKCVDRECAECNKWWDEPYKAPEE